MTPVERELESWIEGDEVARKRFEDGTELVITRDAAQRYTLLRGFPVGKDAAVSVDLQDVKLERLLANLLERWSL